MSGPCRMHPVVVIGAGLAGASVALELATLGIPVVILERDVAPLNRASLRNEGKIHLGFIYANDRTLETARLQLHGALRFGPLLKRWLGDEAGGLATSKPFHYVVARNSIMRPDELDVHYGHVQRMYDDAVAQDVKLDYLGARPVRLFKRVEPRSLANFLRIEGFEATYLTEELAIDTAELADKVRRALDTHPLIEVRTGHRVNTIDEVGTSFRLCGSNGAAAWQIRADQVINCAWEDRLRMDRQAGLEPPPGWLHRLKYRVIAALPADMHAHPSITMVLGAYGDVVVRRDGTAYFSWYPKGLQGWTHEVSVPDEWTGPCRGDLPAKRARLMADDILQAIDRWYPGASRSVPLIVDAGAIVSYGRTDVDDPASGLHDRTRVGVKSRGRYHSLDPGKLTTAPMLGAVAANRIAACA